MNDDELLLRFEDCTLPNECFHHQDHVRVAFLYLTRYPALEALARFSSALRKFAAAAGKPALYNETITWAYLLIIREHMARSNRPLGWQEFAANNPDLLNRRDSVLKSYYREETLKSDLAKTTFLFPDRPRAIL
jgi:hypothetical protein